MNIDEAIRLRLNSVPGVTGPLGAGPALRVHAVVLPEKPQLPAAVITLIDTDRVHSHSGPSGLAFRQFEVQCWAQDLPAARRVDEAILAALDGYQGTQTNAAGESLYINSILALDGGGGGGYDYDDDRKLYGITTQYRIAHNFTVPPLV